MTNPATVVDDGFTDEQSPTERLAEVCDEAGDADCVAYIVLREDGSVRTGYVARPGTNLYQLVGHLEELKRVVCDDASVEKMDPSVAGMTRN